MINIRPEDRKLFMRFAVPCAGTLVNRGNITKEKWDELIDIVRLGKEIPDGAESIFKVALAACSLMAIDRGRGMIDEDIIYSYYLHGHDEVIDRRFTEMGDFDPVACRIRKGLVLSVENDFALVKNEFGIKKYRKDFLPDVESGDMVITHWDFLIKRAEE